MSSEICIPYNIAEMICRMEDICFGEGQGSSNAKLMLWIRLAYPELHKKYAHLPWPAFKIEAPFFVMLRTYSGSYIPLTLEGVLEDVLARFETENDAQKCARNNPLGKSFGFRVFQMG